MTGWQVRASTEDDWRAYRSLRLEMLVDTPIAFLETVEQARAHPDDYWRTRDGNRSETSRLFGAVDGDGSWLGTMGVFHPPGARNPLLVGVYVTPAFRGRDHRLTDALLTSAAEWAGERADRLLLHVHEQNEPAIRYYRRHGFEPTGVTVPYPLQPGGLEVEMALPLTPGAPRL
ncbi:GNAT family N-acetyltransferase [Leifsonia sp. NPDC058248]|uniref:GNAT family N-acetyltransferase n=1 Tax=Leifsonia sp. NPDC058248 TaxID=3346402 RepID=UPI0036D8F6D5